MLIDLVAWVIAMKMVTVKTLFERAVDDDWDDIHKQIALIKSDRKN